DLFDFLYICGKPSPSAEMRSLVLLAVFVTVSFACEDKITTCYKLSKEFCQYKSWRESCPRYCNVCTPPTQPPRERSDCRDISSLCSNYNRYEYCKNGYYQRVCKKRCGLCSKTKKTTPELATTPGLTTPGLASTPKLASTPESETTPGLTTTNIPAKHTSEIPSGCQDTHKDCRYMKNLCNNYEFVRGLCPKLCNMC
uniref:ShKT domain-containing protein n=1 Tax=Clytia hemisphaerica TaxID=252671 RepID=A0A7M5WYJ0_9CNID